MPGRDGTGPAGAMTCRGFGCCAGHTAGFGLRLAYRRGFGAGAGKTCFARRRIRRNTK